MFLTFCTWRTLKGKLGTQSGHLGTRALEGDLGTRALKEHLATRAFKGHLDTRALKALGHLSTQGTRELDGHLNTRACYLTESDTRFEITNEIAKWVPQVTFCLACPVLLCLKFCWSLGKVGMHKGICFPKNVALHLYPDCMGPVSKQNVLEADAIAETRTSLSLESLLFGKFDEIFGKEVSNLNCPWDSLTDNLPPYSA